jgi:hypothetical protein
MSEAYYISIIGVVLHFGTELVNAFMKNDFKISIFVKRNLPGFILSLFTAPLVIFLLWEPTVTDKDISMIVERMGPFTLGYFSNSILTKAVKMARNAIDKKLGNVKTD